VEGENLVLDACIASLGGEDYIRRQVAGPQGDADGLGRRAADELLAAGAGRILKLAGRHVAGD
jgi:hypothetical protein